MIPLRDTIPSASTPVVTRLLIAANVVVFLYQQSLGRDVTSFLVQWGLVPDRFVHAGLAGGATLVTSVFLHGGWLHVIGNLLYLHIFGDNVEDRVGHLRFLAMYLLCGAVAGLAQVAIDPASDIPIIGASGAIAGVTGAYLLFFPRARVVALVPVFIVLQVMEVPAVAFLVLWFAYQVLLGVGSLAAEGGGGGIAFWAHIGGFLAGMLLGPLLARTGRLKAAW